MQYCSHVTTFLPLQVSLCSTWSSAPVLVQDLQQQAGGPASRWTGGLPAAQGVARLLLIAHTAWPSDAVAAASACAGYHCQSGKAQCQAAHTRVQAAAQGHAVRMMRTGLFQVQQRPMAVRAMITHHQGLPDDAGDGDGDHGPVQQRVHGEGSDGPDSTKCGQHQLSSAERLCMQVPSRQVLIQGFRPARAQHQVMQDTCACCARKQAPARTMH